MSVGKKITDLTASGSLKDTDLAIVHDGNGTKRSTLTQLSEYLGTKFSNPNLLINPDFKINQRGKTSYEVAGFDYTVDRWRVSSSNVAVSESGGITILSSGSAGSWFTQKLEKELEGIATLSIKVSNINGRISLSSPSNNLFITSPGVYSITLSDITEFNMFLDPNTSVTIEWTKLEKGSIATPFIAPNPADELAKCKRFYNRISITETFYAATVGKAYRFSYVVQSMRIKPTVVYRQVYDFGISQEEALVKDDVATTVVVSAKAGKTGDCSVEGIISLDAEIYQ